MSHTGTNAIVVLPCAASFALTVAGCERWLARASASRQPGDGSLLHAVLAELSLPVPETGLAGLRYWGQTGAPPSGWCAGADPVWLQAGLDKLYLHAPAAGDVDANTLRELFADLQRALFDDDESRLEAIANVGYLLASAECATSPLPADAIVGQRPDPYLPGGPSATRYLQLSGEIQMALHDHASNRQRELNGQPPINSLWLWGGGTVTGSVPRTLPALFADEPLLRGYWSYSQAPVRDWPGTLSDCASVADGSLVAVVPPPGGGESVDFIAVQLQELQALQSEAQLRDLALLFADRTVLRVRRSDRYRFWRRALSLPAGDDS